MLESDVQLCWLPVGTSRKISKNWCRFDRSVKPREYFQKNDTALVYTDKMWHPAKVKNLSINGIVPGNKQFIKKVRNCIVIWAFNNSASSFKGTFISTYSYTFAANTSF